MFSVWMGWLGRKKEVFVVEEQSSKDLLPKGKGATSWAQVEGWAGHSSITIRKKTKCEHKCTPGCGNNGGKMMWYAPDFIDFLHEKKS